jgi:hypothetical protein
MYNVLSLGAGVQSSTLAMMYAKKELSPMPDFAVFADTQGEPKAVYKWLNWLEKQLPFPVYRVSKGNLKKDSLKLRTSKVTGLKYIRSTVPFYLFNKGKSKGFLRRGCTEEYKIRPIKSFVRRKCKIKYGETNVRVKQIIGISTDEIVRVKQSNVAWIKHVFPLIENNISRQNCLEWFKKNNLEIPPRSACIFCPYHSNAFWKNLKENSPKEFEEAVKYEKDAKKIYKKTHLFSDPKYDVSIYYQNNLENFDNKKDIKQLDMFDAECEGMCGV